MVDEIWMDDNKEYTQLVNQLVIIRKLWKHPRMTQSDVAIAMNSDLKIVWRIEHMKHEVPLPALMKYARAVGAKITFNVTILD